MRKVFVSVVALVSLSCLLSFAYKARAEDKAAYTSFEYVKTREVANKVASFTFTTAATNTTINLQRTACQVNVRVLTDAGSVYVNPCGEKALNTTSTTGTTWAGDNKLHEAGATPFSTLGVEVGDILVMTEGDGNDGIYYVTAVNTTTLSLDRNTTVTNDGDQNYNIKSPDVDENDGWREFKVGTTAIGVMAGTTTPVVQIEVLYQR